MSDDREPIGADLDAVADAKRPVGRCAVNGAELNSGLIGRRTLQVLVHSASHFEQVA
jgi:hypothetical protein